VKGKCEKVGQLGGDKMIELLPSKLELTLMAIAIGLGILGAILLLLGW
jgi:hypothetical protein